MIALLHRLVRPRPTLDVAQDEEARAFLGTPLASMPEVQPPVAVNDDPLQPIHAEVERELRVAGLIR